MLISTLFVRVVPQERGRGWMLLASWEKPVVQRTCAQLLTLQGVTQQMIDGLKEKLKADYRVTEVKDVTDASVLKQLAKEFAKSESASQ